MKLNAPQTTLMFSVGIGILMACATQAVAGGPTGPDDRASAMIERAELQEQALHWNLLFGYAPAGDVFEFAEVQQTVADWFCDVDEAIAAAHELFNNEQHDQAKTEAELAKDIADAINNFYGYTIGYWAHKGAFDRADFRVLVIRDDNHNYEWWDDTWYVRDILISLGYSVEAVEEGTLLGPYGSAEELAEHFREYGVIWLSNPGCGFDDAITVQALKLAMDTGVGIVLQGDDAIISIPAHNMPEVEAISGLAPYPVETNGTHVDGALYDNNIGNFYDVAVASGHPLQSGIAGTTFRYGDDIDTTVSVGASVIAWATPVPTGYDTQKPVIAGYEDPATGGKSATVLLTVSELEVYNSLLDPAFDDTLCDNIILWVAR